MLHGCLVGAAPEDDAGDIVPPVRANQLRNLLAVLAGIESLDFPNVRLHTRGVEVLDRPEHESWSNLPVVAALVLTDGLELAGLGRNEQLEKEFAISLVEPVTELPEPHRLCGVHLSVTVGVVPDQHLGKRRVEVFDVIRELLAVFEIELVLSALLHGHGQVEPFGPGLASDIGAVLLVDQKPGPLAESALLNGALEPLEDHPLRIDEAVQFLWGGLGSHAHLLSKGAPMIQGQDVQPSSVS